MSSDIIIVDLDVKITFKYLVQPVICSIYRQIIHILVYVYTVTSLYACKCTAVYSRARARGTGTAIKSFFIVGDQRDREYPFIIGELSDPDKRLVAPSNRIPCDFTVTPDDDNRNRAFVTLRMLYLFLIPSFHQFSSME